MQKLIGIVAFVALYATLVAVIGVSPRAAQTGPPILDQWAKTIDSVGYLISIPPRSEVVAPATSKVLEGIEAGANPAGPAADDEAVTCDNCESESWSTPSRVQQPSEA